MITKNVLIASTLMLASVPALFAASPWVPAERSRAPRSQPARNPAYSAAEDSDWLGSISVEGFYGHALTKLETDDLDKLDIGGVSFRYTATRSDPLSKTQSVYPEFFGMFSLGGGSLDQTWYYGYYESEELNYDLFTTQLAAGCNLRCPVSERVSVFAGVRAGIAYENVDVEANYYYYSSHARYSGKEDAIGFLYGGEIGADFLVNEKLSLFACVGYVASTARTEFDVYGDKYKLKAQSYLTFSFGVRYMF
ncbi:MAG: outer membrane protein [Candidatus Spyradosoma sp.]